MCHMQSIKRNINYSRYEKWHEAEQFVFELYYSKMEEYLIDLDSYFELQSQFNYQDIDIPVNPVFWLYSQLRAIHSIFNNQFRFKVD